MQVLFDRNCLFQHRSIIHCTGAAVTHSAAHIQCHVWALLGSVPGVLNASFSTITY